MHPDYELIVRIHQGINSSGENRVVNAHGKFVEHKRSVIMGKNALQTLENYGGSLFLRPEQEYYVNQLSGPTVARRPINSATVKFGFNVVHCHPWGRLLPIS